MTTERPTWPPRSLILDALAERLVTRRWFPGGDLTGAQVIHYADVDGTDRFRSLVIQLDNGTWVHVPLAWEPDGAGADVLGEVGEGGVLVDACVHPGYVAAWLEATIAADGLAPLPDQDGTRLADALRAALPQARPLGQEQSNTSLLLPGPMPAIVKFFRVLSPGDHPEVEVPLALAASGFTAVPTPLGASTMMVTGPGREAEPTCTASVAALVPDAEDGFDHFLALAAAGEVPTAEARALGETTRSLHDHLATAFGEGEPMSGGALARRIHTEARQAMAASATLRADTDTLGHLDALAGVLQGLGALPPAQRIHGDFHLGQCLFSAGAWFILDFEGEPLRPLAERIHPDQRLRDVAGLLRSLDYARALAGAPTSWAEAGADAFLEGYFGPEGPNPAERLLLQAFVIEKALYEIRYETTSRPHLEHIPATALRSAVRAF